MCSISAWGQTGPYAELMGVDVITQAQTGIAHMSSDPGERPHFVGFPVTDILAGVTAFGAICSALYRRSQTGQGEYIDIAMYECLICALYNSVGTHVMTKGEREYRYMGSFSPDFSPCGAYKGRDGYLAIFGRTDVAWERITELMGKPELNKDPRYDSLANRVKNNKEVTAIVEEWLQTFEKVSDAAALLQSQRVMAGPVNSVGQVIDEDPQWQAREMMHEMEHPVFGPINFLNSPLRFRNAKSGTETTAAVNPGEHTAPVLRELLNLSDAEIEALRQRRVVSDESREG
jgi:crotonobetainyl-CoA:carnitine CoA-transferase CaiB-like acyl-CoA transferase